MGESKSELNSPYFFSLTSPRSGGYTTVSSSESVEVSDWTEEVDPVSLFDSHPFSSEESEVKVAEWSEWAFPRILELHFKSTTETTLKSAQALRADSVKDCYKEIETIVKSCGGNKMTSSRVKGLLKLTSDFWNLLAETSKTLSIVRKSVQRRLNLAIQVSECINDPSRGCREILKKSLQQLLERNDQPTLTQLLEKWRAVQTKIEKEEKRGKSDELRRMFKNGGVILSILACVAGIFLSLAAIPPLGAALSIATGVAVKLSITGTCLAVVTPGIGAAVHKQWKGPSLPPTYFDHLQRMAQDSKNIETLFTQIQIPSQEVGLSRDDLIDWKYLPQSKFFQTTLLEHSKALTILSSKILEIENVIQQSLRDYAEDLYPSIFQLIK